MKDGYGPEEKAPRGEGGPGGREGGRKKHKRGKGKRKMKGRG